MSQLRYILQRDVFNVHVYTCTYTYIVHILLHILPAEVKPLMIGSGMKSTRKPAHNTHIHVHTYNAHKCSVSLENRLSAKLTLLSRYYMCIMYIHVEWCVSIQRLGPLVVDYPGLFSTAYQVVMSCFACEAWLNLLSCHLSIHKFGPATAGQNHCLG